MHPIEKIHNMIISGNILGPKGTWVSRTDALKKKRYILKHVLNGEVEVDGRWVKLNEVDINPKHPPPLFLFRHLQLQNNPLNHPYNFRPMSTTTIHHLNG